MSKSSFTVSPLECDAFDQRVITRHVARGRITTDELQKELKGLPDEADNIEVFQVHFGPDPVPEDVPDEVSEEADE